MYPRKPKANAPDILSRDAVLLSESSLANARCDLAANFQNLFVDQFVSPLPGPAIGSAVHSPVVLIVFLRVPSEIIKAVIELVAVVMAALHAVGAWANKCEKHEAVGAKNLGGFDSVAQAIHRISVLMPAGPQSPPRPAYFSPWTSVDPSTPNASVCSNAISQIAGDNAI